MSNEITRVKKSYRRFAIAAAVAAITTVSGVVGRSHTLIPKESVVTLTLASTDIDMLSEKVRQEVKELKYSNEVVENFVRVVGKWKDVQGQPALAVLRKILTGLKEACRRGDISKTKLAKAEERIMMDLCRCIKREVVYRRDYFDLADIIEDRQANCFGYSQLFYVLGNSIGLYVRAMNVTPDHIANIVGLSDGTMTVVDLIRTEGFISERIITDNEYEGNGSYWMYKDRNNLVRNGKTIHILDRDELISEIYFCRGTVHYMSGQGTEAIVFYDKAVEFNPRCARAYNNRGGANLILSKHDEAISNFSRAIELAPGYASAYHNRGNAYLDLKQYSKAVLDYTNAIEIDPGFAKAYFGRGYAYLALGQYDRSISDYTKAIELNPEYARAYYTRAIGYASLTEREKARRDMLKAVALDHTLKTEAEKISTEFELNLQFD
jgi:tetratricopeptide (TPR) repeat protein